MNQKYRLLALSIAIVLIVSTFPALAQSALLGGSVRQTNASSGSPYGGDLVIGYTGEPANIFNPITLFAAYAYLINSLTYESLFQWDTHLNLVPDLALNYTVTPDGKTYTFNLRPNVTWSDGVPFTAHDVEFTIDVTLNQSFSAGFFYTPLAMNSNGTTPTGLTLNKTMVSIPNNNTIIFHLSQPYAPFLLYTSSLPTLAEHVLIGQNLTNDNYINNHIIGTGPFIVTQYVVGDHITMVANPHYWGGRPHLNSVTWKVFQDQTSAEIALRNGEVNYIEAVPPQDVPSLNSTPGITVRTEPGWNLEYMGYNFNKYLADGSFNPVSIKAVRQAISEAVNASQVVSVGYKGYATPVNQFMIPFFTINGNPLYNQSIPTPSFNATDADKLLNESGYPWTPSGGNVSNGATYRFQLTTIISAGNSQELTMLQAIQSMLSNVGIDLVIKVEEEATATADIAGAPQPKSWNMFGPTHISESPDPDFMASLFYNTPATVGPYGSDWTNYNNSAVNSLYLAAEATVNNTQRAQIYQKIGGILSADYAWLWLDNPQEIVAWNSNFKGFVLGPEGISAGVQGALSPYSLLNVTYSGPGSTTSSTTSSSSILSTSSGSGTSSSATSTSASTTASSSTSSVVTSSSQSTTQSSQGNSNMTILIAGIVVAIIVIVGIIAALMRRRR